MNRVIPFLLFASLLIACGKTVPFDPAVENPYGEDYVTFMDLDIAKRALVSSRLPTYNKEKDQITVGYSYALTDPAGTPDADQDMAALEIKHNPDLVNLKPESEYKRAAYKQWIEPRLRPIKDELCDFRAEIGAFPNPGYYFIYIRDYPHIVANKTIFGREAGTPLDDLFFVPDVMSIYKDENNVFHLKKYEDSYDKAVYPSNERRFDLYFAPNTLWRSSWQFISYSFPEELNNHEEVLLTVTFPVTVEHFWDYVLKLARNESATEEFTDLDLSFTVALKYDRD